jgi:ubiquinone/menaquinone biosynthesis C-methylase UbiE
MEKFPSQNLPENEISIENSEEETFKLYVKDLDLKPEDFKKSILDVGAGEAHFAKWAKDNNISSKIYSLDPFENMSLKEKSLVGDVEAIPMPNESFDLVVSNAAIPNIYLGERDVREKIKKSFFEMVRVLKDNGEIRLSRVLMGYRYESQMVLTDSIKEALKDLKEKYGIEITKIHTPENDTYEYDGNHNKKGLLAESFLIILKKGNS